MKKFNFIAALCLVAVCLSSCNFVEGVFKAGFIIGAIIVIAIVAIVIYLFRSTMNTKD